MSAVDKDKNSYTSYVFIFNEFILIISKTALFMCDFRLTHWSSNEMRCSGILRGE